MAKPLIERAPTKTTSDEADSRRIPPALPGAAAAWLAFLASGAVLVLEILSLRLVAPYLGLTLETSTAVIGFALAAIALGAWLGGRAADTFPPQRILGPMVLLSGVLVLFVGPAVRWTGEQVRGGDATAVLAMAAVAILAPAALLSAVTPLLVKLRLQALDETGRVVGRLSGVSTLGALVATFATGFILVAEMPTSRILLTLGIVLIVLGLALTTYLRGWAGAYAFLVFAALGLNASSFFPPPCDVETAYHCARVVPDPTRPSGRTLVMDTLFHSYVDIADPSYLEFSYTRSFASAVDAAKPEVPLEALHIGGGGFSIPMYLDHTRPGSQSLVLEIDRGVVELDVEKLGLQLGNGIDVRIGDGRVGLYEQEAESRDLVVEDAFGGLAVPWHLTTVETAREIRRILRPDGVYLVNVIDFAPLLFARAEAATIAEAFPHVALISRPDVLEGSGGDNLVFVASESPLPVDRITAELAQRVPEYTLIEGDEYQKFAGEARVLTDDYAPVDQLVTLHDQAG
ncbi:MAG TPA: fused MFS/spermidine synthase [Actinomycetota bacterium]|nr:fused MFS/spermidine synthase [Actinomycetota bacterium]